MEGKCKRIAERIEKGVERGEGSGEWCKKEKGG
jgi:hypothetical protein